MVKEEQIRKEIQAIDEQIQSLSETRCTSLVCTTNEHDAALHMQELMEKRMELYYQLNATSTTSKEIKKDEKEAYQQRLEIAKNLFDVLTEEVIAEKVGLPLELVKTLKSK